MLPAKNRIAELKREIALIANCPKANHETAGQHAIALIACYPGHQWGDEMVAKAYMRQLSEALAGVDLDILAAMISPKSGLPTQTKRLPTIAEVHEFIERGYEPKQRDIRLYMNEIERVEDDQIRETLTPEERARRADMLKKLSETIKATAKAKDMANSKLPTPIQIDGAKANPLRLQALKNLDEMRGIYDEDIDFIGQPVRED